MVREEGVQLGKWYELRLQKWPLPPGLNFLIPKMGANSLTALLLFSERDITMH